MQSYVLAEEKTNTRYSIAARLIKGIDQDAFATFLSKEYGTGGKGVYLNERKIISVVRSGGIKVRKR